MSFVCKNALLARVGNLQTVLWILAFAPLHVQFMGIGVLRQPWVVGSDMEHSHNQSIVLIPREQRVA